MNHLAKEKNKLEAKLAKLNDTKRPKRSSTSDNYSSGAVGSVDKKTGKDILGVLVKRSK